MDNVAHIPATGKHSELINYIYRQAKKLTNKGESRCKYASVGDRWRG
ncbi:MAG: hypothetical protein KAS32_03105 [Candidatus Peribacteraceae bacterium]|nr:hypothetical protein [Candidatus Peribacteraceae bacterium]